MHKIKGKITNIGEVVSGVSKAGKDWNKLEFSILTNDEKYPKTVIFSLLKQDQLEGHKVGSQVEVTFVLDSRDYNGKTYHNVTATNISRPSTDLPF